MVIAGTPHGEEAGGYATGCQVGMKSRSLP